MSERVKSSSLDQRLNHTLGAALLPNPGQVVLEARKVARLASLDNRFHNVLSDVANCSQTESNILTHRCEHANRFTNRRWQNLDPHAATFV